MKSRIRSANRKAKKQAAGDTRFLSGFRHWEWPLIFAALICDWNSWGHQFLLDDSSYLVENTFLQDPRNLLKLFTSPFVPSTAGTGQMYRPLTAFAFAVNYWVSGMSPDGFHFVNRLLHVLICLCLFWVLRRLFPPASRVPLFTSLLFAVHPIQTEAVTYITGRSDALALLLFLFAWLAYLRARSATSHTARPYAASLLLYFLALLSKESAITWLGVALLTERVYLFRGRLRAFGLHLWNLFLRFYAGYLLVTVAYLAVHAWVLKRLIKVTVSFLDNPLTNVPLSVRLLTALKTLFQSLALLVWPLHLSADYSYNQIPLLTRWTSLPALIVLALTAALLSMLVYSYRRAPHVFFGLAYFLTTYSLVSNLLIPIGTIRADRLLYMPSIGILLLAGLALARLENLLERNSVKKLFYAGFALLLVLLTVGTIRRNKDWEDGLSLSLQTVHTSPHSAKAHQSLGSVYLSRKQYDLALEQYRMAESIYADTAGLLSDLGSALMQLGRTGEAVSYYRRAVALAPAYPIIRFNLARALQAHGDYAEANAENEAILASYDNWIRKDPSNPEHHFNKANVLYFQGRLSDALAEFQETLRLDPRFDPARKSIDLVLRKMSTSQPTR